MVFVYAEFFMVQFPRLMAHTYRQIWLLDLWWSHAQGMSSSDLESIFNQMDEDGDGLVSFVQCCEYCKKTYFFTQTLLGFPVSCKYCRYACLCCGVAVDLISDMKHQVSPVRWRPWMAVDKINQDRALARRLGIECEEQAFEYATSIWDSKCCWRCRRWCLHFHCPILFVYQSPDFACLVTQASLAVCLGVPNWIALFTATQHDAP
jgi:hypothetical protein